MKRKSMNISKINGKMQLLAIEIEKNTKKMIKMIEEICMMVEKEKQ